MDIRISNISSWSFLGGQWNENADGVICPPTIPVQRGASAYEGQRTTNTDEFLALHTGAMYSDFEAEFEFRRD